MRIQTLHKLNDPTATPIAGAVVSSPSGKFDRNPFQLNLPTQMLLENIFRKITSPISALIVVICATVGGLLLRWIELGKASLWFDEGYSAWAISLPMRGIVKVISVDTAPPLYYLTLHGWVMLFGRSEIGLRSMSALMASMGFIFFIAIVRRVLQTPWGRAAAVLLFAISFMQVAYAHEARFYAMMTMMGAIDFYLVLLVCERASVLRLVLLVMSWTISLYTNNLMTIYLACLGIAWLMLPGPRPVSSRMRDLVIVALISGLSFAPWLPTALAQTHRVQGGFWVAAPDFMGLAGAFGVLTGVQEQDANMRLIFAAVVTLLSIGFITSKSSDQLRRAIALICFGVLPVLIIFFYSRIKQSIFVERAFLPSGIAMSLLVAIAFEAARNKVAKFVSGMAVVVLFCLCLRSLPSQLCGEHPENWRDASAFANSSPAKHRLVVCVANDGEPLYRYYGCHSDYSLRSDVTGAPNSFFAAEPPCTLVQVKNDNELNTLKKQLDGGAFDEVILMASHTWWADPEERTLRLISARMPQVDRQVFNAITVFRYRPVHH